MIDICIANYNTKQFLIKCIDSFCTHTSVDYNLFVVDDGSKDGSVEWLKNQENLVSTCNNSRIGYGRSINQGLKKGNNPYICVSNADIEVFPGWDNLIKLCCDKVAVVGPKLLFSDGRIGGCGVIGTDENPILRGWQEKDMGQYDRIEEVLSVCGAFFVMRRSVWEEMEGFDEGFFLYFEETDLFRRVREAGYKVLYYPFEKIIHHWDKSPKNDGINYFEQSKRLYNEKWGKRQAS